MGKPTSLLREANAFARDFPRDKMPQGYLWDMADFVPTTLDAQLTGRGGWTWGSVAHTAEFVGGIYAPFINGDRLLAIDAAQNMQRVDLTSGALTNWGAVGPIL